MKSILQEASSIKKAIELAWNEAGKPVEFTIKVLDSGETGILWFTKRPAIVSITYDPRKQRSQTQSKTTDRRDKKSRPARTSGPRPNRTFKTDNTSSTIKSDARHKPRLNDEESRLRPEPAKQNPMKEWTPEWTTLINNWLKEITAIIGITIPFETKADRRTLQITFNKNPLPSPDEERMLYISFSFLLMQFLKKKYKKKFRGFQLFINSKRPTDNDKKQSSSS